MYQLKIRRGDGGHDASRAALALACVMSLAGLSACQREVLRYDAGLYMGSQGHASEVVFEGEGVRATREAHEGSLAQGPTYAWRDDSLSIRAPQSAYDQAAWPEPRRPSLDRPGRVFLYRSSDTVTFFRTEGVQFRSQRGGLYVP